MSSSIAGLGVHSGTHCTVTVIRSDTPVQFIRAGTRIPASSRAVTGTRGCTELGKDGARVAMVEHLLAALHVAGFWSGLTIEVSAEELPILDGSAAPWLELLTGLGEPPPAPQPVTPTRQIQVEAAGGRITFEPGAQQLSCEIDFPHPAIGRQSWTGTPADYADLLEARTFGFLKEFEELRDAGLARGANLGNTVVFDDSGPLQPLRHPQEPVRHKALDALGDLFLLQAPLNGAVRVTRGTHRLHHAFVTELQSLFVPEALP